MAAPQPPEAIESVNTFIGTQDEGNTFPGASMPFGKAHSSPITSHYAGFRYDDQVIRGFGHFFLSGAGCWEQGGLVSILPMYGPLPGVFDQRRYGARFTHDGEIGKPGYYKVRLDRDITVECTATTRTGVERYTFPSGINGTLLVNVGQANEKEPVSASSVKILGDRTIVGTVESQAFCGGKPYITHFATRFDRPFHAFGTWSSGGSAPNTRESAGGAGLRGAWVTFDPGPVTAMTALSNVDADGATLNLTEATDKTFDEIRVLAQDAWRDELACIEIETDDWDDRAVFYTALYHVLLQPLTGNDLDGRYRGFDNKIHTADGWTYYEFFSLWDTYRAHNQLIALLRTTRARDIARSILAIHEQGGWLPRWAYSNQETNCMTGDPVTPFLVDLWRFGALKGFEEQAYRALLQNATGMPAASSPFQGRAGNPNYLQHGFVQYDKAFRKKGQDVDPHHGASATLEYALGDATLAIMAGELGHREDAEQLRQRGRNHRVLWDPTVTDRGFAGFPRPKLLGGGWLKPYTPQGPEGFHEGTAWQYQWLVQHDVPGLIDALGGKVAAEARLDDFFAYSDLLVDPARTAREKWVVGPYDYYNQFRYNPNNEPDLHAPWMYALIGKPEKTSVVVRAAQTLFVNGPKGVTGNDDLGTMSAWYVFSALGMYPVVPGTGEFVLHAPRFTRAVIHLENGRDVIVKAESANPTQLQHVQRVRGGWLSRNKTQVDLAELRGGITLDVELVDL
ncbi:GH92 family glycosyl hydrolase [Lentzea sp. NBRC 105346]|uniref:GH92 family glycosyl hydrolase n=1 Tax=Lentzea sp. NBRC 105346 TaxID=3032205 RepID=UPI0025527F21|nr:GH92 family glycosyl hydrolase [Lentzea sp. NBRC 105346]